MTNWHDEMWIITGRPEVPEAKGWRRLFCLHRELPDAPRRTHRYHRDIIHVQCERCSGWSYSKDVPSQAGRVLKEMFGG